MPLNEIPLSALATAVPTDETRRALADAGVLSFRGSEAEALALLAIKAGDNAPACHGSTYAPSRPLCAGCVFATSCWREDKGYLRALASGDVDAPRHVPPTVAATIAKPYKPKRRPPKARTRK